jgi:hypothetical protein
MSTHIMRGLAAAVSALAVAGAALVAPPAASANGTLSITPQQGSGDSALSVSTSGGCASASATHYSIKLSGGRLTEDISMNGVQLLSAIPAVGSQTTAMSVPVAYTFAMAQENYGSAIPTGVYDLRFICRSQASPAPITVYTTKVTIRQISGGLTFAEGAQPTAVVNKAKPKISGKGSVGATLRVSTGTWEPKPDRTTVQWRIGKKTIGTGATYKVKKGDRGKTITAVVTATKAGLTPGTASAKIKIAK